MKMLKRGLLIFCIIVLLGFLFNLLAFLLPQNLIHQNILASIGSFRKEGQSPRLIEGYSATALDNNSDAWILLMCDYDGDHSEKHSKRSIKNGGTRAKNQQIYS